MSTNARFKVINFNPRSREGSDKFSILTPRSLLVFQSSLPRGERPRKRLYNCGVSRDFNPRSREGSDRMIDGGFQLSNDISILAPARGATFCISSY